MGPVEPGTSAQAARLSRNIPMADRIGMIDPVWYCVISTPSMVPDSLLVLKAVEVDVFRS